MHQSLFKLKPATIMIKPLGTQKHPTSIDEITIPVLPTFIYRSTVW